MAKRLLGKEVNEALVASLQSSLLAIIKSPYFLKMEGF